MKPSIPKGTRDFSPTEMARRNFILNTIKTVYERYGFQQIETPTMENLSTLEGKYGEEGDKLLFRILNSGNGFREGVVDFLPYENIILKLLDEFVSLTNKSDFDAKVVVDLLEKDAFKKAFSKNTVFINSNSNLASDTTFLKRIFGDFLDSLPQTYLNRLVAEKGLRYDLTVPFARYVVMHQNEITFPFKRYQMQPVWRADRPQKGRYREFYQCDADVIGSPSLLNEVELIQIIDEVFSKLGVGVEIKINNRKILSGLAEYFGISPDRFTDFVIALDKIDKIGLDAVELELERNGLGTINLRDLISPFKSTTPSNFKMANLFFTTDELKKKFADKSIEIGLIGVREIEEIVSKFHRTNTNLWIDISDNNLLNLDLTLARGLNYYTGAIFEVKVNDSRSTFTSSVLGGGRYDDLTGIFGLPNVSGVGISFGIDRIYDVMLEMNLFEQLQLNESTTKVLFVNFGKEEEKYSLSILSKLRNAGVNSEIYPDAAAKMKKQMSYADAKKIPYVVLIGTEEMQTGKLTLKNMQSGEQEKVEVEELIKRLN